MLSSSVGHTASSSSVEAHGWQQQHYFKRNHSCTPPPSQLPFCPNWQMAANSRGARRVGNRGGCLFSACVDDPVNAEPGPHHPSPSSSPNGKWGGKHTSQLLLLLLLGLVVLNVCSLASYRQMILEWELLCQVRKICSNGNLNLIITLWYKRPFLFSF